MTSTFLQARITAIQAQIIAYETAITAVSTGGIETYTLDTGQSRQTVTKLNITALQNVVTSLMNQLAVLEARLYGNGTVIARPSW